MRRRRRWRCERECEREQEPRPFPKEGGGRREGGEETAFRFIQTERRTPTASSERDRPVPTHSITSMPSRGMICVGLVVLFPRSGPSPSSARSVC